MGEVLSRSASWQSQLEVASLRCGTFSASISLEEPQRGLFDIAPEGNVVGGNLFAPVGLPEPIETYLRGDDFVSTHAAVESFPFRCQLYWSAVQLELVTGVAVTLEVSLQTDLLDTRPSLVLATDLGAAKTMADQTIELATKSSSQIFLAPHPTDATEVEFATSESGAQMVFSPPFLEKGVIRRSRFAAFFLPADSTPRDRTTALEEFAATPLPLTT